jgi:polyphenol oxidase
LITNCLNLYLGVKTADCVPIFFYVPNNNVIGVVHAGWKSTFTKITDQLIDKLVDQGILVKDIYVLIGPYIHACCYQVDDARVKIFKSIIKTDKIFEKRSGLFFLDLGKVNRELLLKKGILPSHIEIETDCTCCKNNIYFSYRKDTKETFGEMLSIVGIKA